MNRVWEEVIIIVCFGVVGGLAVAAAQRFFPAGTLKKEA